MHCVLGSRIRDMEAESNNWSHLSVNIWITYCFFWWAEMALWDDLYIDLSAKVCARYNVVCSNSLHNHGKITPLSQPKELWTNSLKKTLFCGCMVWPWCCLFQPKVPVKILLKILLISHICRNSFRTCVSWIQEQSRFLESQKKHLHRGGLEP